MGCLPALLRASAVGTTQQLLDMGTTELRELRNESGLPQVNEPLHKTEDARSHGRPEFTVSFIDLRDLLGSRAP